MSQSPLSVRLAAWASTSTHLKTGARYVTAHALIAQVLLLQTAPLVSIRTMILSSHRLPTRPVLARTSIAKTVSQSPLSVRLAAWASTSTHLKTGARYVTTHALIAQVILLQTAPLVSTRTRILSSHRLQTRPVLARLLLVLTAQVSLLYVRVVRKDSSSTLQTHFASLVTHPARTVLLSDLTDVQAVLTTSYSTHRHRQLVRLPLLTQAVASAVQLKAACRAKETTSASLARQDLLSRTIPARKHRQTQLRLDS